MLFDVGFVQAKDLLFDLNITESYNIFSIEIDKTNFLVWACLRHAISSHLKSESKEITLFTFLDIIRKKLEGCYSLFISIFKELRRADLQAISRFG